MKRIRILAALVIVVCIVTQVSDFAEGFMDGWNEAGASTKHSVAPMKQVHLRVAATQSADSLFNTALDARVPYRMDELVTEVRYPYWYDLEYLIIFPFSLFCLYGFWSIARMVVSVSRGKVFTRQNVRRLRIFIYSMLLFAACFELMSWQMYRIAADQVMLEDYVLLPYKLKYSWLTLSMLALFTEIFAVGVKLKEEQELTI